MGFWATLDGQRKTGAESVENFVHLSRLEKELQGSEVDAETTVATAARRVGEHGKAEDVVLEKEI